MRKGKLLRLPEELHQKAAALAERQGLSLNALIIQALISYLRKYKED